MILCIFYKKSGGLFTLSASLVTIHNYLFHIYKKMISLSIPLFSDIKSDHHTECSCRHKYVQHYLCRISGYRAVRLSTGN